MRKRDEYSDPIQYPTEKWCGDCNGLRPIAEFSARKKNPIWTRDWNCYCRLHSNIRRQARVDQGYKPPPRDLAGQLWSAKSRNFKARIEEGRTPRKLTITIEELRELLQAQTVDGKLRCAASGIILDTIKDSPFSPSIDRIDLSKDYEIGNIRIVALIYNLARYKWSDQIANNALKQLAPNLPT